MSRNNIANENISSKNISSENTEHIERRDEARYICMGINVLYSAVDTATPKDIADTMGNARLFDMSQSGLSFDLDEYIEPGKNIKIVISDEPYTMTETLLSEVIWSEIIDDKTYRSGLRIISSESELESTTPQPVIEALNKTNEYPVCIHMHCPSCSKLDKFSFRGIQSLSNNPDYALPLYDCNNCGSTRSITSILTYNRNLLAK